MPEPTQPAERQGAAQLLPAAERVRVFISYASAEKSIADELCATLERAGIQCWIAPRDVKAGALYADAIVRAINNAVAFVLILSESSIASTHVSKELERASSKKRLIIAMRTDAAPLTPAFEYFLSECQWIEASGPNQDFANARLIDAIRSLQSPEAPRTSAPAANPKGRTPRSHRKLLTMGFAVTALVVIAALAARFIGFKYYSTGLPSSGPSVAISEKSIAVLPFTDLSEQRDQAYFAAGLAEEVLSLLATLPDLKVISRTSSFQFKSQDMDVRTIGSRLGVKYLLEGSVRRVETRVRVVAQLVSAQDGTHRWGDSYESDLKDILKLQQEIASSIGRALQVEVGAVGWAAPQTFVNSDAYTSFLKGLHAFDRYDQGGFEEAASYFEHALALDATFGRPRELLTLTHFLQYAFAFVPPKAGAALVRQDVDSVLRNNPNSAIGHAVHGRLLTTYDWNWKAAQTEIDQALRLERNGAIQLYGAADLAGVLGEWDRAVRWFREALAVDPLDADTRAELAFTLFRAGRLSEAEAEARKVLEIRPTFDGAHADLGDILLARGHPQDALHEYEREADQGRQAVSLAIVHYALGRAGESAAELHRAEVDFGESQTFNIAEAHAYRGEANAAFEWLDRAYKNHDFLLQYIKGDWFLKPIRSDSRYDQFLRRLNLPD